VSAASPPPASKLTWFEHAIGAAKTLLHLSAAGLVVAAIVAIVWVASAFADHLRKLREGQAQAPQPVIVTAPTPQQARVQVVPVTVPVGADKLTAAQEMYYEKLYNLVAGQLAPAKPGEPQPAPGAPPKLLPLPEQTIPPAPAGGSALPTLDAQGGFDLHLHLNPVPPPPLFQLGGHRRLGLDEDFLDHRAGAFADWDLFSFRQGGTASDRRVVIGLRPFVDYGYRDKTINRGAQITAAIDF
jgi:hypothetical protein